jgi:hypothetical protein
MTTDDRGGDGDLRDQLEGAFVFARRALRFWPTVPIVLAVGGIACALFFLIRKPAYRSETVVLYSQGASAADSPEQSGAARNVTVRMKELLMSRPKLERVVAEFGLYPEVRSELGPAETVEELKKHIEFRAPGGDTFSIAFIGRSPIEAQRVTARLAGLIIEQDAELRRKQARDMRDFLVAEKAKTEATLRTAERDLAAFMAKHPRFALDTTPLATGAAIRATVPGSSTAPSVGPGRVSLNALRVPATPGSGASSGAVTNPAIRSPLDADSDFARANAALVAARAHLAEQLERYTPAHPDVRAAGSAVERAEARVAALPPVSRAPVPATPATPSAPAPSSETKPTVVPVPRTAARPSEAVASSSSSPTGDVVALETEWLKLTRGVTEARQRQDQVESALFKADILASSASGGHGLSMTIIDPAFLPARPEPPGRTLIAALFFEGRDASGPAELLVEVPRSSRRVHVAG